MRPDGLSDLSPPAAEFGEPCQAPAKRGRGDPTITSAAMTSCVAADLLFDDLTRTHHGGLNSAFDSDGCRMV